MFFDDTVVKTFHVQNQPLLEYPNTRDLTAPLMRSVLQSEDQGVHVQRHIIGTFGKPNVHQFDNSIESGRYDPGFPDVLVSLKFSKNAAVIDAIRDIFGDINPGILSGRVSLLTDLDWVIYFNYSDETAVFNNDGLLVVSHWNEITEEYVFCEMVAASLNESKPDFTYDIILRDIENSYRYEVELVTTKKPEGLFYFVYFYHQVAHPELGSVTEYGLFCYLSSSDVYPDLTLPNFDFSEQLECQGSGDTSPIFEYQDEPDVECWDKRIDGMPSACCTIKFKGKYFFYYIGASGDRCDCGPAYRRLGLVTSTDLLTFNNESSVSWIYEYNENDNDEEGFFGMSARVVGDNLELFFTAVVGAEGVVAAEIRKIVSSDGISFGPSSLVIDKSDTPYFNDEIGVTGFDGDWLYYFGKSAPEVFFPECCETWSVARYNLITHEHQYVGIGHALCGSGATIHTTRGTYIHTSVGSHKSPDKYYCKCDDKWHGKSGWYDRFNIYFQKVDSEGHTVSGDFHYCSFDGLGSHAVFYDEEAELWILYYQHWYPSPGRRGGPLYVMTWDHDNSSFPVASDWTDKKMIVDEGCVHPPATPPILPGPGGPIDECGWGGGPGIPVDPPVIQPPLPDGENVVSHPFPPIPIRKENKNYNDYEGMTDEEKETAEEAAFELDHMMKKIGIDTNQLIDDIMSSPDIEGDEDKIDTLYVTFATRIWDHSQAGRQYCFRFFSTLCAYSMMLDPNQDPWVQPQEDDPFYNDNFGEGDPVEPSLFEKYAVKNSVSVQTKDKDYAYSFTFDMLDSGFILKADLELFGNEALKKIYYYDTQKFKNGDLLKDYYMSSGSMIYEVGYLLSTPDDIERYLLWEPVQRDYPLVPDDHPGREMLRCSRRINYDGVIYGADGDPVDPLVEPDMIPEKIYKRRDNGDGTFGIQIQVEPTDQLPQHVVYYKITDEGLYWVKVYAPMAFARVTDTETGVTAIVTFTASSVNDLSIPFIYSIILPINNHDASDMFLSSMHLSVYVADVTVTKKPWWRIILEFISIVISIWTGGWGYVAVAVMFAMEAFLAEMIFELLGDNAGWAMLAASVIMMVLSRGTGGFSLGAMTFSNIATLISQFAQILSGIVTNITKDNLADLLEEQQDLISQQKSQLAEMKSNTKESTLDTELLVDSLTETRSTNLIPMNPENYFNMVENFTEMAIAEFDFDNKFANMLKDPLMG